MVVDELGAPLASVACGLLLAAACGGDRDEDKASADGADGINVTATGTGGDGEGGDGPPKLDVNQGETEGDPGDCTDPGGMPGDEFSLIWIANSPEGTVSKIDTKTGVELGRYYTGPTNGADDPSRTSVNLTGDVAVTNRGGGITKIAGEEVRCVDTSGNGAIETSTGPTDILPWGTDECVLWHTPLPVYMGDNRTGPRPTAWDAGTSDNPCLVEGDRVWVGWWDKGDNNGHFNRLNGVTGAVEDDVLIPNWDSTLGRSYGPYGGAVDGDGNFWISGLQGPLAFIDSDTLMPSLWEMPPETGAYGIAVDANGHPWTAGLNGDLVHFDPATNQFDVYTIAAQRFRGVMFDREGQAWVAENSPCGLAQFDLASLTFVNMNIPLPGCVTPVGVSIDVDGFVWAPDQGAGLAFKVNPADYTATTTPGLVSPYTYSDMTGAGLGLVVDPPQG